MENIESPNQVLVNKYLKNDALGFHVEDINAFGESILGLSLGSDDYLRLAPMDQYGHNKKG
jgi:alkylated DNA repair dioxygenase AlkB